jgi:hypothetical protein
MFDQDAHAEDTSDHITYLLSNSETLTGASGGGIEPFMAIVAA